MKAGIFGGSFDPPHKGHISILRHCINEFGLDKIVIVPTGMPPHKDGLFADAEDRFNMCRLAFGDFYVSDFEIRKSGYCYSADMLEHFAKELHDDELYFIIGGDSIAYIDKWHEPERIFATAKIIVAARDKADEAVIEKQRKKFGGEIYAASNPLVGISSTEIRNMIKCGKPVGDIIDKEVEEYILKHNLYR